VAERVVERGLRWLATRRSSRPFGFLKHAIEEPHGDSASQLEPLVSRTASWGVGTAEARAFAIWGLIVDTIHRIGSTEDSRRRNVLFAAFQLPRRVEIREEWKVTLEGRFDQLKVLARAFGDPPPSTTAPMHKAWRLALTEKLAPMLQIQLDELSAEPGAWQRYVRIGEETEARIRSEHMSEASGGDALAEYRAPSQWAQPVFLDLFVTTVFMKKRSVYRRITERLVTAREDNVEAYIAASLAGGSGDVNGVPVRALWGCHAEPLVPSRRGEPALTRLRFPRKLRLGEKHWFSSEAIDENVTEERRWVNVEVDHHGIAPGRLHHDRLPVEGLTIRIRFDEGYLPDACWWYEEQTERERRVKPLAGENRLLPLKGDTVEHTFVHRCHPRGHYGVSLLWPDRP
jgi:hypothetical protein